MFRSIISPIISQIRKPFESRASQFCTNALTRRPRRYNDVNHVSLIGTLTMDSYEHRPGSKLLTVRTYESPQNSSDHNIRIDTNTNFRAGQRIHVTGKLKSIFKRTNDGKNLTVAFVKAEQLSILKGGSNPTSTDGDLNNVELVSYVCDVKNTGMYSFLSLATHYKYVTPSGEEDYGAQYHRVYAYDDNVRQYIQKNMFRINDRVVVHGRIGHRTFIFDGKEIITGFVIPNSIFRIPHQPRPMEMAQNVGNRKQQ